MATHLLYKSLYISLPSSVQQPRERGTQTTAGNLSYFQLNSVELTVVVTYLALTETV